MLQWVKPYINADIIFFEIHTSHSYMKVSEILETGRVVLDIEAGDKTELIKRLVNDLRGFVDENLIPGIKEAVLQREDVMSTGVGKGIAIPHAKLQDVDGHLAVFARLKKPVDFGAVDDEPVQLVFLLVGGQKKSGNHIKILSKISRLLNHDNFRNQLLKAPDEQSVIELFREEEEQPA